jgi:nitronate monooxygenase
MTASSKRFVPAVVDAIDGKAPVVLAGGAANGRALAAALMLEAQGIVMGTRFYACEEAAGKEAAKQRIVGANGDQTLPDWLTDNADIRAFVHAAFRKAAHGARNRRAASEIQDLELNPDGGRAASGGSSAGFGGRDGRNMRRSG